MNTNETRTIIIVEPDGTIRKAGADFMLLADWQGLVGGRIEAVPGEKGTVLVIDDEGKLKRKPINPVATALFTGWDMLCGTVVVATMCEDENGERNICGMTDEQTADVYGFLCEEKAIIDKIAAGETPVVPPTL